MARLSHRDAAAWAAVGDRVVRNVERRIDVRVLGNRVEQDRVGWGLRRVGPALAAARLAASHVRAAIVVRTDVEAFYPSVAPGVVHAALSSVGATDAGVAAAGMLDGWGSEGYAGLPIGPQTSAVVANAVLRPVDEAIGGQQFLRWVDDYVIGARDERHAGEIIDRIDVELARLGLRRSEPKTRLHLGDRPVAWLGAAGATGRSC